MTTDSPKEIVRRGWNAVSMVYRPDKATTDAFGHSFEGHRAWLRPLTSSVPAGTRVLDLGCGCGVPDSALLAASFDVTGVDISEVQVERARRLVPKANFMRADMTEVEFPTATFGAVICLYALIHVPLGEQPRLIRRIRDWLVPGGWLVATTGHTAWTGIEANWLGAGVPMYWSHADVDTYARWFRESGFRAVARRSVPESEAKHELFWLRTEKG